MRVTGGVEGSFNESHALMSGARRASLEESQAKVILIVSEDFGFLIWLGYTLAEKAYVTIPVRSSQNALRVLEDLRMPAVDLVITNKSLPGVAELISALRKRRRSLQVIFVEASDFHPPRSQSEWLSRVRQALSEEPETSSG